MTGATKRARTGGVCRGGISALPLRLERPADAQSRADTKYIDAPRPELYDLEKDPKESTNIYPQRRALGGQMRARLHSLEQRLSAAASSARAPAEIDPDTRDRLASLGYVGTFVSSGTEKRSELADPKDKIELFNLITHARDLSRHDKNSDDAIKSLLEVIRQDPKVIDAWFMLGNEYYSKRQFTQAIDSYKQALALKSDYDLVVINMANAYRQLGKDEEALVGYRRFMELDPRNAQIRYEAAQILIDGGKLADARAQLEEALKLQPSMAAARNALGIIALKSGDTAQAEREIRSAIDLKADVRLAHFNLALLAEQRGRPQRGSRRVQARNRALPNQLQGRIQSRAALRTNR